MDNREAGGGSPVSSHPVTLATRQLSSAQRLAEMSCDDTQDSRQNSALLYYFFAQSVLGSRGRMPIISAVIKSCFSFFVTTKFSAQ